MREVRGALGSPCLLPGSPSTQPAWPCSQTRPREHGGPEKAQVPEAAWAAGPMKAAAGASALSPEVGRSPRRWGALSLENWSSSVLVRPRSGLWPLCSPMPTPHGRGARWGGVGWGGSL